LGGTPYISGIHSIIRAPLLTDPPIPEIAVGQDLAPIGEHFKKRDVGFGIDFILRARATPDSKAKILSEYVRMVDLSNLGDSRCLDQFADKDAVRSMDDWRSHVSEEIIGLLPVAPYLAVWSRQWTGQQK
jgi:hypothetical protein